MVQIPKVFNNNDWLLALANYKGQFLAFSNYLSQIFSLTDL